MTHSIGDLFGQEQRPEPSTVIQVSVEVAATPNVVFRALADPRELVAWLSDAPPSDASHGSPAEPSRDTASDVSFTYPRGGAGWLAHVRAPDGTPGTVSGEFLYVVPSRSLTTTWSTSWNRFKQDEVTFELTPLDVAGEAGTRVTVTHRRTARMLVRGATIASARTVADAEGDAWVALLARLATYVAATHALARWGIGSGSDLSQAFDALHRRVVDIHLGESA